MRLRRARYGDELTVSALVQTVLDDVSVERPLTDRSSTPQASDDDDVATVDVDDTLHLSPTRPLLPLDFPADKQFFVSGSSRLLLVSSGRSLPLLQISAPYALSDASAPSLPSGTGMGIGNGSGRGIGIGYGTSIVVGGWTSPPGGVQAAPPGPKPSGMDVANAGVLM